MLGLGWINKKIARAIRGCEAHGIEFRRLVMPLSGIDERTRALDQRARECLAAASSSDIRGTAEHDFPAGEVRHAGESMRDLNEEPEPFLGMNPAHEAESDRSIRSSRRPA